MRERIINILNGNDDSSVKISKIEEVVGFKKENKIIPILPRLLNDFESHLSESKSAYEEYSEYEPRVSELEYLGYDDQDIELHSLRKTMNEYYDKAVKYEEKAIEVKNMILKYHYTEQVENDIEEMIEYYSW